MARGSASVFLAGMVFLLYVDGIHSCTCGNSTREESFCYADAVFNGTVVRVQKEGDERLWMPWDHTKTYRIRVDTVFKNTSPANINSGEIKRVQSAGSGAMCGVLLTEGESYLIEARFSANGEYAELSTHLCTNTDLWDDLSPDQRAMYTGPVNCPTPPPPSEGSAQIPLE